MRLPPRGGRGRMRCNWSSLFDGRICRPGSCSRGGLAHCCTPKLPEISLALRNSSVICNSMRAAAVAGDGGVPRLLSVPATGGVPVSKLGVVVSGRAERRACYSWEIVRTRVSALRRLTIRHRRRLRQGWPFHIKRRGQSAHFVTPIRGVTPISKQGIWRHLRIVRLPRSRRWP